MVVEQHYGGEFTKYRNKQYSQAKEERARGMGLLCFHGIVSLDCLSWRWDLARSFTYAGFIPRLAEGSALPEGGMELERGRGICMATIAGLELPVKRVLVDPLPERVEGNR